MQQADCSNYGRECWERGEGAETEERTEKYKQCQRVDLEKLLEIKMEQHQSSSNQHEGQMKHQGRLV